MVFLTIVLVSIMNKVVLIKCPNCGKEQDKPEKSLENCFFQIEAYRCDVCGHCFKVASEVYLG